MPRAHWRAARLAAVALALALPLRAPAAHADSLAIDFDIPSGYVLGSIDGQNGWGGQNPPGTAVNGSIDQAVSAAMALSGTQSYRESSFFTSGSFGDQVFSPSLVDRAGEAGSIAGAFAGGTLQPTFTGTFWFKSATAGAQDSHVVISPDRGDGARMSWVQVSDNVVDPGDGRSGLSVSFFDYRAPVPDDFVFAVLATGLDRSTWHRIDIAMEFYDGPGNDIVRVSVDGGTPFFGTSWEDYFRNNQCPSCGPPDGPGPFTDAPPVDSLLFRVGGGIEGNSGEGFFFDDVSYTSGPCLAATRYVATTGSDTFNDCSVAATSCLTVQHAVDVACPGDTILVSPGTYPETVSAGHGGVVAGAPGLDIDKSVIILSTSGAAVTTITNFGGHCLPTSCPGGPLNLVTLSSSGITIDGFTILETDPTVNVIDADGDADSDNHVIKNNVIANPTFDDGNTGGGWAILLGFGSADNNTITGNDISLNPDPSKNQFTAGIFFLGGGSDNNVVSNNHIHNTGSGLILDTGDTGASVSDNQFTDNKVGAIDFGAIGSVFDGNSFFNNGRSGLELRNGATGATVTDNCFGGNGVAPPTFDPCPFGGCVVSPFGAIRIDDDGTPGATTGTQIHNNNFIGDNAPFGVDDLTSASTNLDGAAELNWWGCPTGANTGTCDTTTANVDAIPFLAAPAVGTPCTALITPCSLDGWEIVNFDHTLDPPNGADIGDATTASGTDGTFVSGPATPPLGSGSFQEVVGTSGDPTSGDDATRIRTGNCNGTLLADVLSGPFSYWTYVTSFGSGGQATYIQLRIDQDNNGSTDDALFFEPVYQNGGYSMIVQCQGGSNDAAQCTVNSECPGGICAPGAPVPDQCPLDPVNCVVLNTWQFWNTSIGGWWSNNESAGGPPLITLADYAAEHPGAKVATDNPSLRLQAGFGGAAWAGFNGATDDLTACGTTYDFEPEVCPTPTPTATPTPTVTPTPTPTPTPPNHFQCYEVHAPVRNFGTFSLNDRFGPSTASVVEARRLCAPADKNDEDPTAPTDADHLTGYRIKQSTPFTRVRGLSITNQFGPQTIDLTKPDYLLVPSSKDRNSPPPPIVPAVDHFKCYKAKGKLRASGIKVDDQFGTLTVNLTRMIRFCAAVDKNGGGIMNPTANLACYKVRLPSGNPLAPGTVFINNQFGADSFGVFRPTELCVPSQVNGPAQPTPTPTPTATATPMQPTPTATQTPPPIPLCCGAAVFDGCIDADGTASPGDGIPAAVETLLGDPLTPFPAVLNGSGLDMFDTDGNAAWTFGPAGDDLHAEGPTFCPTAIRDGIHQVGLDCVVLDLDGSLFNGQPVNCDVETGAFCVPPLPSPISFHDTNGNGAWDDGEDIVLDVNGDGICD